MENFKQLRGQLAYQHPLASYTAWRVGGNAELFYHPADLADLQCFLTQLPNDIPITCLGLGSNVLIRDKGLAGVVILTLNRLKELSCLHETQIYAQAGVPCAKLAKLCVAQGFENGAFFAGIPGTIGGALAMNAGAFGGETWQSVIAVETINRFGEIKKRTPQEFAIHYREVKGLNNEHFVSGTFQFPLGDALLAKKKISALLKKRNESQPIGTHNCGSVFRNPPNDYAARLIETAGLKGFAIGQARISEKHANFIINEGGAKASQIEALIQHIQEAVKTQHGIVLMPEVHMLGR